MERRTSVHHLKIRRKRSSGRRNRKNRVLSREDSSFQVFGNRVQVSWVKELHGMNDKNAITVIQDETSCNVYWMPYEVTRLGRLSYEVPFGDIGPKLVVIADTCRNFLSDNGYVT